MNTEMTKMLEADMFQILIALDQLKTIAPSPAAPATTPPPKAPSAAASPTKLTNSPRLAKSRLELFHTMERMFPLWKTH